MANVGKYSIHGACGKDFTTKKKHVKKGFREGFQPTFGKDEMKDVTTKKEKITRLQKMIEK